MITEQSIGVLDARQRFAALEARVAALEAAQPDAAKPIVMLRIRYGILVSQHIRAAVIQPDTIAQAVAKLRSDHIAWVRPQDEAAVTAQIEGTGTDGSRDQ